MKSIEHNARKLLKDGLIKGCWFSNASVRVQCLDGRSLSFDHELDLFEAFPGYEGYTFDTNFYDKILNNDLLEQFTGFYGGYGINNDVIDPVESGDAWFQLRSIYFSHSRFNVGFLNSILGYFPLYFVKFREIDH